MPPEILDLITKELKRRFGENPSSPEAVQAMQQIMDDTDYRNKFITQAQEGTPGGTLPDWEIGGRNIHEGTKWGLSAAALAPLLVPAGILSGPVGWGLGALGGLGWAGYGATEIAEAAQRQKAGLPGTGALVGGEGFGQSGWGALDVLPLPLDLLPLAKGIRGARAATKAATEGLTDLGEFRTLRTDEPYEKIPTFEAVPGQGGDTIPTRPVDTSSPILQGRKVEQDPLKHVQETIGGEGVGALAGDEAAKYAKTASKVTSAADPEAVRQGQRRASMAARGKFSTQVGDLPYESKSKFRKARLAKIAENKKVAEKAAAEAAKNQEASTVARMQQLEKEISEAEAGREAVRRRNPQYVVKEEGRWSGDAPRYGSELNRPDPLDRPLGLPSGLTPGQDFGRHGWSPGPGLGGPPSPKRPAQSVQAAEVAAKATPDVSSENAVRWQVYEALERAQRTKRTARGTIIKHRLDAKDAKAAKGLEDHYTRYEKAVEMLLDPKTDDKLRTVLETVLDNFKTRIKGLKHPGSKALKKAYKDLIKTDDDLRRLMQDAKDQPDYWRMVQQNYKDMAGTGSFPAGGPSVRTPEKAWINLSGKGNQ